MEAEVVINVISFGDPQVGIWCNGCMLPAAIRVRLVGQDGMNVIEMGSYDICPDCEDLTHADST